MALFKRLSKDFNTDERLNFFELISIFVSVSMDAKEGVQCYREDLPKKNPIYGLCGQLIRDMDNGATFSEALAKHPKSFPPFITGMLSLAESTGKLEKTLNEIVYRLSLSHDINQKISNATFIPKISFIGIIIVIITFIGIVIPKIGDTFYEMNMDLPFITQAVLGLGNFFMDFWFLIAIAAAGSIAAYQWFRKTHPEEMAKLIMSLPFWKPVALNHARYDFCTIMHICVEAGIAPVRAMEFTAMACENIYLKKTIMRAVKRINSSGMDFDEALRREDTFPVMNNTIYSLLKGARKTGQLNQILSKQTEHWQRNLKASTETIGDKIGMITLLPIYVLIMILATAIILPIAQMGSGIAL